MKYKAVLAYILVFTLNCLSFFEPQKVLDYLIPALLVLLPIMAGSRINFIFSRSHIIAGLCVCLAVLLPYTLIEMYAERAFEMPNIKFIIFQLIAVAIPEEIFFRGFLQHSIGNNCKAVLVTSLLFSFAHLPVFVIYTDIYPLLTFFPSIVLGLIYMKTKNLLPCIMFHFLSNILWAGFR